MSAITAPRFFERSYLRERLIKEGVAIAAATRPPYELAINARGVSCPLSPSPGKRDGNFYPTLEDLRRVPTRKGKEIDLLSTVYQPENRFTSCATKSHVRFSIKTEAEITCV